MQSEMHIMADEGETFGEIVNATGARDHRVRYVITRLKIKPVRKCGSAHLYPDGTAKRVQTELLRLDNRRALAATS